MRKIVMAALACGLLNFGLAAPAARAQWPHWKDKVVRPNIDLIPPLGNHLPPSYASRYNRPKYLTGKLMYTIEPSSQEAMAWQRARNLGYYANHAPRMETRYLYRKPWEALGPGPRPNPNPPKPSRDRNDSAAEAAPADSEMPEPPQPDLRTPEPLPEAIETPERIDPAAEKASQPSLTELLQNAAAGASTVESSPSEALPPIRLVPAN